MAEDTAISWTDSTANFWWGCEEVHDGCNFCYARTFAENRTGKHVWGEEPRRLVKSVWSALAKWQREAPAFRAEHGRDRRVFVGSMMDIFEKQHEAVDHKGEPVEGGIDEPRRRFFEEVVPASPDLVFLLLTKRPSMVRKLVPASWLQPGGWPPNVWVGTSVVNQQTADTLIPQLLRLPGPLFLSMEPLLGPVDLSEHLKAMQLARLAGAFGADVFSPSPVAPGILWIIVGGESGGKDIRPMHPDWARSLRDQAKAAGIVFHFKQWGEYLPFGQLGDLTDERHKVKAVDLQPDSPDGRWPTYRFGKDRTGHLLDGEELQAFPEFAEYVR